MDHSNNKSIELHKISKYTLKLANSQNKSKMDLYKNKLAYHTFKMNKMYGGDDSILQQIEEQKNKTIIALDAMNDDGVKAQTAFGTNLGTIKKAIAELRQKLNNVEQRLKEESEKLQKCEDELKNTGNKSRNDIETKSQEHDKCMAEVAKLTDEKTKLEGDLQKALAAQKEVSGKVMGLSENKILVDKKYEDSMTDIMEELRKINTGTSNGLDSDVDNTSNQQKQPQTTNPQTQPKTNPLTTNPFDNTQ